MKMLSYFLLALTFSNLTWATVEYGTLDIEGGNTSLVLNQGDIFEVTNFDYLYSADSGRVTVFKFTAPNGTVRNFIYDMSHAKSTNICPEYITIYGPSIITLGGDSDWLMYKLTRASNPQPTTAATTEN